MRDDLNQLGFSDNLDELKSLSKFKIKAVVKEKVTKYAFNFLTNKLLTSSKLSKLRYCELELQDYFTHHKVTAEEMRIVFRFRTRMLTFGENFRGNNFGRLCPLCNKHIDCQDTLNDCQVIRNKFKDDFSGCIRNLYSTYQTTEAIKMLSEVINYREIVVNSSQ